MALRCTVCLLAVLAAGCATADSTGQGQDADPVGVRVLRIGVSRSAPPLIYEEDGETRGLEADMARRLTAELNMQPRFVPMFFPNLIFEIRQKNIDIIMAGMSIAPARRREVAFAEPYMIVGQQALTDIVVTDSTAAAWIAADRDDADLIVVPGLFTEESLAWAVHRDDKRLLGEINGVLRKWKADGTLDQMIARWVSPRSD